MIRVAAVVVSRGQQREQKGIMLYTWINSVEMGCVGVHVPTLCNVVAGAG